MEEEICSIDRINQLPNATTEHVFGIAFKSSPHKRIDNAAAARRYRTKAEQAQNTQTNKQK
jgi:hypothetical protein